MEEYRFYKDSQGWFIDLPSFPGPKAALAMVAGADTFLDLLAQGESEVILILSTTKIEGYEELHRTLIHGLNISDRGLGGADYLIKTYKGQEYNHPMWLCPVTMYVFGKYPETIYFTVA